MKNPTWDDSRPHTDEEIKVEIRRMTGEIEQMLESSRQSDERTQRNIEETGRTLQRIREKLNVARPL